MTLSVYWTLSNKQATLYSLPRGALVQIVTGMCGLGNNFLVQDGAFICHLYTPNWEVFIKSDPKLVHYFKK